MDADLYDEFGNYIGPELDSDDEEEDVRPPGQEEEAERSDEDMEKVRCVTCDRSLINFLLRFKPIPNRLRRLSSATRPL